MVWIDTIDKFMEVFINIVYDILRNVDTVSESIFWYSISIFFHSGSYYESRKYFLRLTPIFPLYINER